MSGGTQVSRLRGMVGFGRMPRPGSRRLGLNGHGPLPWVLGIGLATLSLIIGWREHRLQLDRHTKLFEEKVQAEIVILRRELATRETLAKVAVATFDPVYALDPDIIVSFSRRLLPLIPNVYSVVWAPRLSEQEVVGALRLVGRTEPVPFPPAMEAATPGPDDARFMVLDIQPRTQANLSARGLVISSARLTAVTIGAAVQAGAPRATPPLQLVQLPGVNAFVIYGPVRNDDGVVRGVLGFSYRFDELFGAPADSGLSVSIVDRDAPEFGPVHRHGDAAGGDRTTVELSFAGRFYEATYVSSTSANALAMRDALALFGLASLLSALLAGVAFWLSRLNGRLRASLAAEKASEEHLRVLVGELNHRIKNVLALVLSLARQSFTRDKDPADAGRLFESRIMMLADASVLSVGPDDRPDFAALARLTVELFGSRLEASGPDIPLGPRAGQLVALMLHELATNATKHGAMATPLGKVSLTWSVAGGHAHVLWKESAPRASSPPPMESKGFGARLLTGLIPRQLRGEGALSLEPDGLRYTLAAPLEALRE